ncbi:hypothetical protein ACOSQ2_026029 [Xanthoceras sorbifolium]
MLILFLLILAIVLMLRLLLIKLDVWGPSPIVSSHGYKYYVSFIDSFTSCKLLATDGPPFGNSNFIILFYFLNNLHEFLKILLINNFKNIVRIYKEETEWWCSFFILSYIFICLSLYNSFVYLLLLGHGGTDGLHAYVHSLDDAVSDLLTILGFHVFCFRHSTGAAIVLKAMLDPKIEGRVAGVVVTSPAVGVQPSHPIYTVLAPTVAFLLPRYQFSAANKKGMPVSRDPRALVAKYSDPLVYTGSIRVWTGYEILPVSTHLQQNLKRLRVPFLVLHGTADTIIDPNASQKLYEETSSTDKTIKLLDGFLHDLLFEPERDEIVDDIIEWLNCRV